MNGALIGGIVAGAVGVVLLIVTCVLGFVVLPNYVDDQIIEVTGRT